MKEWDAVVIGGGIAGVSLAYSFSKRKKQILLVERQKDYCLEASGNPLGVASPFLTKYPTPDSLFSLECFRYLLTEWEKILQTSPKKMQEVAFHFGVRFLLDSKNENRYEEAIRSHGLPPEEGQIWMNTPLFREGRPYPKSLFFPRGLCFSPRDWAQVLWSFCGSFCEFSFHNSFVSWKKGNDGRFYVTTEKGTFVSKTLVLANGEGSLHTNLPFPLQKVRGQLLQLHNFPEETLENHSLHYGGYLTSHLGGGPILGATYQEYTEDSSPREKDSWDLIQEIGSILPEWSTVWEEYKSKKRPYTERVGFRIQLADRRPILGSLPLSLETDIPEPRLFACLGFGSRGLNLSLLSAECVVAEILEEPLPISESLYNEFSPKRFYLRKKKKQSGKKTETDFPPA